MCRERLCDWHEAGVWAALHAVLLAEWHHADKIDKESCDARLLEGAGAEMVEKPDALIQYVGNPASVRLVD